jgi:lysozyme
MRTIAIGALVGVLLWLATRREDVTNAINEGVYQVGEIVNATLGTNFNSVAQANMRKLTPYIEDVRKNRNVVAFLHVIRHREHLPSIAHTTEAYTVLCGGGRFTSFADHPRPNLPSPCSMGAAGAYQIIIGTWDELVREAGLEDFSPVNQERGAVYRIAYRGALNDVIAGNLQEAIRKCRNEWTSLPGANEQGSGYTYAVAREVFAQYGGVLAVGN